MLRRHGFVWATGLLAGLVWGASADAADYRVRTLSLGRANHHIAPRRRGMITERVYTQGATLDAYDLLSDGPGSLNLHLDVRYSTDFALSSDRRDDPLHATEWNRLDLALSYVEWRPVEGLELRAGRQWSRGTLGPRDFDGVRLQLRPRLDASTRGRVVVYGGREVQYTTDPFNPDAYDVPGLPRRTDGAPDPGTPWIAGGTLGVDWAEGSSVAFGVRQRWRTGSGAPTTGSERLGMATSLVPTDPVTVSAHASYHTLLRAVDRAAFDIAWNLPEPIGTATLGVAHRRPWFDSASIFNLFGARPHREARLSYRHRVDSLASTFDASGWGRIYDGDPYAESIFWGNDRSARRLGGSVGHHTHLQMLERTVQWDSHVALELDPARTGDERLLADTRLRVPLGPEGLFVFGELAYLGLQSRGPRGRGGSALNYLLGADLPITEIGTFGVTAELATGALQPAHVNLFGVLEFDLWS